LFFFGADIHIWLTLFFIFGFIFKDWNTFLYFWIKRKSISNESLCDYWEFKWKWIKDDHECSL
jgi:hypothetical protein